jgi:hypothetical protein
MASIVENIIEPKEVTDEQLNNLADQVNSTEITTKSEQESKNGSEENLAVIDVKQRKKLDKLFG